MRNKENIKRLNRNRYLRIKDTQEYKNQKRAWYVANREEILRNNKEKRVLKPRILKTEEEIKEKRRVWNLANKEKRNTLARKWRQKNLIQQRQYARDYYKNNLSEKTQYGRLVATARDRNYELSLSFEDFTRIIYTPCKYCGEEKERIGIDRIDNEKGYTKDNSAPCCKICNYMKKTLTTQDFLNHITKIFIYNEKN